MGFTCEDLTKTYHAPERNLYAVAGVNLRVEDQQFVCLVGPSGCGKSTLLKLIAGLLEPSKGRVRFDAQPASSRIMAAMVFQEQGLYPWLNVVENAAFGMECIGIESHKAQSMASLFLQQLGLGDFLKDFPSQLSGGMRQRVAIARAILADPEILLMDEPFGSLDAQSRVILLDELLRIWTTYRKTVIYVTHDIEEALLLADQVVVMTGRPGRVLEKISIDVCRPRREILSSDADLAQIRKRIWSLIEADVRQELHVSQNR